MNKKAVISKLDDLLKSVNFTRQKTTWNRRSGYVVEVIDMQIGEAGDIVTVGAGVLDTGVYVELWGRQPPEFVEEPACTVRARMGEFIDGKDTWWQLNDAQVTDKVSKVVIDYMLPFVSRMCSRQSMVQWLIDSEVVRKKYPLPIINLAILQYFLGKTSEGCALLAEMQKRAIGAWRARATEVAERLGCEK